MTKASNVVAIVSSRSEHYYLKFSHNWIERPSFEIIYEIICMWLVLNSNW